MSTPFSFHHISFSSLPLLPPILFLHFLFTLLTRIHPRFSQILDQHALWELVLADETVKGLTGAQWAERIFGIPDKAVAAKANAYKGGFGYTQLKASCEAGYNLCRKSPVRINPLVPLTLFEILCSLVLFCRRCAASAPPLSWRTFWARLA